MWPSNLRKALTCRCAHALTCNLRRSHADVQTCNLRRSHATLGGDMQVRMRVRTRVSSMGCWAMCCTCFRHTTCPLNCLGCAWLHVSRCIAACPRILRLHAPGASRPCPGVSHNCNCEVVCLAEMRPFNGDAEEFSHGCKWMAGVRVRAHWCTSYLYVLDTDARAWSRLP